MVIIKDIPVETITELKSAWGVMDEQMQITPIPNDLSLVFKIYVQAALGELIACHYIDDVTQEGFRDNYDYSVIDDYVSCIAENDDSDALMSWVELLMTEGVCQENHVWAALMSDWIIMHSDTSDKDRDTRPVVYGAICHVMAHTLKTILNDFNFTRHLEKVPDYVPQNNVEVSFASKTIKFWS